MRSNLVHRRVAPGDLLQQLTTAIMRGRDGLELAQAQAMIDQLPLSLFGTKGVMDFEEYVTIMMQE